MNEEISDLLKQALALPPAASAGFGRFALESLAESVDPLGRS